MAKELIKKNTNKDKHNILRDTLERVYDTDQGSAWLIDFDDDFVYFEYYQYDGHVTFTWKVGYTYNGTSASFGDDVVEQVRLTQWSDVVRTEDVAKSEEGSMLKSILQAINSLGSPKKEVLKSVADGELMQSIEPLYIKADTEDFDQDTIDYDGAVELVKAFNEDKPVFNLFHIWDDVDGKVATFKSASVSDQDRYLDEVLIPAGQPIVTVQWHSQEAWEMRKSGRLLGPSVGCTCDVEILYEED